MLFTSKGIAAASRMQDETNEVQGYQLMSNIYQLQGDYKTALDYQLVYSKAQDKFAKEQRNRQIIDLEIKNAIKEKQKEIEQLTRENEYQALLLKQNEQIAEQNAQLLAANEELRQFAYVASHDLKEPIRMIGSYTQLIERKHKHQFTEDSQIYFTYVKEGVIRMNNLLDALLKYTTISKTEDNFEQVSLVDVVEVAVINLRVSVDENNAVINCHELPEVMSIRSLLIQLFQNLISNAIKFKKPNTHPKITITSETTKNEIIIKVSDDGIGIKTEYQERIFIIFQRLHTRDEYKGTGIGLAICHKIVQRVGGRIWVESEIGKGANFFIALPRG
jgi:light-regulated signal transduction histidine kinase (bacteriophytochrome)